MKTLTQVILPITLVAALIGGVSFFSQYTAVPPPPKPKPKAPGTAAKANLPPLQVPVSAVVWDADDPFYSREFEQGSQHAHDFWVANVMTTQALVSLAGKSCTCAQVELGLVPTQATRDWARTVTPLATARNLIGGWGFDPTPLTAISLMKAAKFQPLLVMDSVLAIPGADEATGLQLAIVRMEWEVKEPGAKRLTADVQYRHADGTAGSTKFEVPTVGVPPVLCAPALVNLGELRPGDRREFDVYYWSATRDEFDLSLDHSPDEPCIRFGKPERLSPDECKALPLTLQEIQTRAVPTKPRSAYRVRLTVAEREGGRQLDLGPLEQRLIANKGRSEQEAALVLTGFVRGDLRVGGIGDKDRVNLGEFRSDRSHTKRVELSSERPGMKLTLEGTEPAAMKATLREKPTAAGLWKWELEVEVPPNTVAGPMPANSAVVLRSASQPPRRIRVPVVGTGYVP